MRILGNAVMRNERGRFLEECLAWHLDFLDGVFVYDDQSDDDSAADAYAMGVVVETRSDDVASFLEHEGEFRQAGYEAFESALQPLPGDWVLSFDLDEYFVADGKEREAIITLADLVDTHFTGSNAINVHFEEIFDINGENVYSRIDGFWGDINAPRLFRYEPGGHIPNRQMGCGSVPSYVKADYTPFNVRLLHFGYSNPADRAAKYERYVTHPYHGHNPQHIASIIAVPTLVPWSGTVPWNQ